MGIKYKVYMESTVSCSGYRGMKKDIEGYKNKIK